jgi:hypothetical protein
VGLALRHRSRGGGTNRSWAQMGPKSGARVCPSPRAPGRLRSSAPPFPRATEAFHLLSTVRPYGESTVRREERGSPKARAARSVYLGVSRAPFVVAVLVPMVVAACAGAHTGRSASPESVPTSSSSADRPVATGADGLDGAYQAELDLRDRLADRARTYGAAGQPTPRFPYRVPAKGTFPKREAIARAELVTFGRSSVPGCATEPVTASGAYCADVVAPSVEAPKSELDVLVGLGQGAYGDRVTLAPDGTRHVKRAVTRCDFDPHHAVVFFGHDGRIVGKIVVCFTCHEWIVSPGDDGTGGDAPSVMSVDERKKLALLFDAHGLGARLFDDDDYAERVHDYERRVYGPRELPTPRGLERRRRQLSAGSGLPKDRAIRELTKSERAKLCDFFGREVRPRTHASGYECANGWQYSIDTDPETCTRGPWTCAATVGEIEACLTVFREPDDLCGATQKECKAVIHCLPGLRAMEP